MTQHLLDYTVLRDFSFFVLRDFFEWYGKAFKKDFFPP